MKDMKPNLLKGPHYLVSRDLKGEWRWTYFGRVGEVLAVSGESYASKWEARDGARSAQAELQTQISILIPDAD
jgi:uncharacterized protein YegP (UPF0339 family)